MVHVQLEESSQSIRRIGQKFLLIERACTFRQFIIQRTQIKTVRIYVKRIHICMGNVMHIQFFGQFLSEFGFAGSNRTLHQNYLENQQSIMVNVQMCVLVRWMRTTAIFFSFHLAIFIKTVCGFVEQWPPKIVRFVDVIVWRRSLDAIQLTIGFARNACSLLQTWQLFGECIRYEYLARYQPSQSTSQCYCHSRLISRFNCN